MNKIPRKATKVDSALYEMRRLSASAGGSAFSGGDVPGSESGCSNTAFLKKAILLIISVAPL